MSFLFCMLIGWWLIAGGHWILLSLLAFILGLALGRHSRSETIRYRWGRPC